MTPADDIPLPQAPPRGLGAILDRAALLAEKDQVHLGELLGAFGQASFTPLLILPAAVVVSPLSGIPVLPTLCGLTIFLVTVQMALHRDHVWLPGWLRRQHIGGARLRRNLDRLRPAARWLDARSRPRLELLVGRPLSAILLAFCGLFGLAMPFLELVPFSSSLLGLSIVLMSLAMLTRDGLLALAGLAPPVAAGWIAAAVML